jgi:hypothetical protein
MQMRREHRLLAPRIGRCKRRYTSLNIFSFDHISGAFWLAGMAGRILRRLHDGAGVAAAS